MPPQPYSVVTPPRPCLSRILSPTPELDRLVGTSLLSSPDSLDRCVVLSDLSAGASPTADRMTVGSVTPPSIVSPSKLSTACTDFCRETPLSVRSGRKQKRRRKRLNRSSLPQSPLVDAPSGTPTRGGVAVKTEPKMPKLAPEPTVRYNPDTPLRISIHLPLHELAGVSSEDGPANKSVVADSPVLHSSSDDRRGMYSAGCDPSANSPSPVDLTSHALATMPVLDVDQYSTIGTTTSSGPVYSPISSTSDRSSPNEVVASRQQGPPQPSVKMMASFLDRFSGIAAESLQFSPSRSFWTRSFAEHLAAVNQNGFADTHDPPAPVLSPVPAADRLMPNGADVAFGSRVAPVDASSASKMRHSWDPGATAAGHGLSGVVKLELADDGRRCSEPNVRPGMTAQSNSDCPMLREAVGLNSSVISGADILPGMVHWLKHHDLDRLIGEWHTCI